MPIFHEREHDRILENFVRRGNLDGIKSGLKFFFGKSKNGYITPLYARIKVDHYKLENFGCCSYLELAN